MKIEVKLRPFTVPNFVIAETRPCPRQEAMKEAPSFPLAEVPAETLEQLCVRFRQDVFAKAGKDDPDWKPSKKARA